jgi:hypothetical protein
MDYSWLTTSSSLIAGFGLGAIISAFITISSEKKKLIFEAKLIKYSNLIQAYQDAAKDSNEVRRQDFVSCQKQVELIGSDKIIALSEKFYESEATTTQLRDLMVKAMREDLKKYY